MSLCIQDLSDEHVVDLTRLLARRPEYGIAIPSRRWLQRQQEKIERLPKELVKPSNPLKRLALKIADALDADIADPQAVLCKTHSNLNPFLMRRLFMALAYEVTVHTDPIRSWGGRTSNAELSAFVGRMDSIAALWTEPALFTQIYGQAPFEAHRVFVRSGCEACCLAAIGASGRALADLRAGLVDRMERRRGSPQRRAKQPRLFRVVEAWIDHLRKGKEDISRPEGCRALSESLLTELRAARPEIKTWRHEQKRQHARLQAEERPVFSELRSTGEGHVVVALPAKYGHKRRTKHGIPVALADIEGAASQRAAASNKADTDTIYRPDSLAGSSIVTSQGQRARYGRPDAPEPTRLSGPSHGSPTSSFVNRFEQEIGPAYAGAADPYEEFCDGQDPENERDPVGEEQSRRKVQQWWTNQVADSQRGLSLSQDDTRSMLSMVHPAFRPDDSHISPSALPSPLRVHKAEHGNVGSRTHAPSEWTDWTVHTDNTAGPDLTNAPPLPAIPSKYRNMSRFGNETPTPPPGPPSSSLPTSPIASAARPSSTVYDPRQSTVPFPAYVDPLDDAAAAAAAHPSSSLNWPAPPQGRRPDPNRYRFADSEIAPAGPQQQQRAHSSNNNSDTPRRRRLSATASSSVYSRMTDGTPLMNANARRDEDSLHPHDSASCSQWAPRPPQHGNDNKNNSSRHPDNGSSVTQWRDFM